MNNIEIVKNYINECGLSIIKIKQGDNTPIGEWKKFQARKLNEQEIFNRFSNDTELRIAIICGEISGNLEAIKIANTLGMAEELFLQYRELPDVQSILNKCVIEKAESGELHIYYRCSEISGKKQELAMWPKVTKTNNEQVVYETVIETCGEGAYIVCAPSKGYTLGQGGFDTISTISTDERETLLSAARTFNKKVTEAKVPSDRKKYQAGTPSSLYNKSDSAVKECENLLEKNGWKRNGGGYWLQPGKQNGISAIYEENRFRVVATNASPFQCAE